MVGMSGSGEFCGLMSGFLNVKSYVEHDALTIGGECRMWNSRNHRIIYTYSSPKNIWSITERQTLELYMKVPVEVVTIMLQIPRIRLKLMQDIQSHGIRDLVFCLPMMVRIFNVDSCTAARLVTRVLDTNLVAARPAAYGQGC